jgi:hypothetical protein
MPLPAAVAAWVVAVPAWEGVDSEGVEHDQADLVEGVDLVEGRVRVEILAVVAALAANRAAALVDRDSVEWEA